MLDCKTPIHHVVQVPQGRPCPRDESTHHRVIHIHCIHPLRQRLGVYRAGRPAVPESQRLVPACSDEHVHGAHEEAVPDGRVMGRNLQGTWQRGVGGQVGCCKVQDLVAFLSRHMLSKQCPYVCTSYAHACMSRCSRCSCMLTCTHDCACSHAFTMPAFGRDTYVYLPRGTGTCRRRGACTLK